MPLPTAWTMVRVFGQYLRIDGTPNQGSVKFELDQRVVITDDAGVVIGVIPKKQVAELDATGAFEIYLPATDDPAISPNGWTYQVTEGFNGGDKTGYSIEVPTSLATTGGINLVEYPHATPVPVNPPVVTYLRVQDIGVTVASQADMQQAINIANAADTKADAAVATATSAAADAANALTVANAIDGKAQSALDASAAATVTANDAKATADAIDGKAQTALDQSTEALDTANDAMAALGPIGTGGTVGAMLTGNGPGVPPIYTFFKSTLASAISRTFQSKGDDTASVFDMPGVVANNVNDDTAGLQQAMISAAAAGKSLLVPKGTYLVSASYPFTEQSTSRIAALNVPGGLTIEFEPGVVFRSADYTGGLDYRALFLVRNTSNVIFRGQALLDGQLLTDESNASKKPKIGVCIYGSSKVQLKELRMQNFAYHGASTYASDTSIASDILYEQLVSDNGAQSSLMVYSSFVNAGTAPNQRIVVRDCIGKNSKHFFGLEMRGCVDSRVEGGYYTGNAASGVNLEELCARVVVKKVTVASNGGGFAVSGDQGACNDITFEDCVQTAATGSAVPIYAGSRIRFVRCKLMGGTSIGINVLTPTTLAATDQLQLEDCEITGFVTGVLYRGTNLSLVRGSITGNTTADVQLSGDGTRIADTVVGTWAYDSGARSISGWTTDIDASYGPSFNVIGRLNTDGSTRVRVVGQSPTGTEFGSMDFCRDLTNKGHWELYGLNGGARTRLFSALADGSFALSSSTSVGNSGDVFMSQGSAKAAVWSPVMASFKNKLINGNFDFWQRGTSISAAAAIRYLSDRWQLSSSGTTNAASQQAFAVAQTAVPNNPRFFHRVVVASVAGASNYCTVGQRIENAQQFAGQTCTLSFYAKADAAKNIGLETLRSYGTGGSPSSAELGLNVSSFALTTAWQKFSFTFTLPTDVGKTYGTNLDDYIGVQFWLDCGSSFTSRGTIGQQSGTFDFAQLQLEMGTVATPFELRPLAFEETLCQRYFEKSYATNVAIGTVTLQGANVLQIQGVANAANSCGNTIAFKVEKRVAPTITVYSTATGASGKSRDLSNNTDVTPTATYVGTTAFTIVASSSVATTLYNMGSHWTADSEL